jgi:hypothetical protein
MATYNKHTFYVKNKTKTKTKYFLGVWNTLPYKIITFCFVFQESLSRQHVWDICLNSIYFSCYQHKFLIYLIHQFQKIAEICRNNKNLIWRSTQNVRVQSYTSSFLCWFFFFKPFKHFLKYIKNNFAFR